MIVISKYRILSSNEKYYIVTKEQLFCPNCHGVLRPRDTKRRKAIEADGTVRIYYLRRLKCRSCGVMHLELPDLFIPHKHYTRHAIEMALNNPNSACPAETSTIYRWSKERERNQAYFLKNTSAAPV